MMYPSLRGGNQNPGTKEGFYGEVDDVIAAAKYLKKLPYVDPNRIYIGGHSTGGTLTMLVAETTDLFRAAIAFGPVDDVSRYGFDSGFVPINFADKQEVRLRSPGYWLNSVKKPLWVFEGGSGNITSLRRMEASNKNANIHFIAVPAATHFSILSPINALLAQKLAGDSGAVCSLALTADEVNAAYR
jgi:acetyl esterase/lipase